MMSSIWEELERSRSEMRRKLAEIKKNSLVDKLARLEEEEADLENKREFLVAERALTREKIVLERVTLRLCDSEEDFD